MKGQNKPKLKVLFDLLTLLYLDHPKKKKKTLTFEVPCSLCYNAMPFCLFWGRLCRLFCSFYWVLFCFFFYVNESKGASFSHMPIDKQVSEESRGGGSCPLSTSLGSAPEYSHPWSIMEELSVCLASLFFANLFYYLAFFTIIHGSQLHFLVLFIGHTELFQLTFTFIYSTFSKKFSISAK